MSTKTISVTGDGAPWMFEIEPERSIPMARKIEAEWSEGGRNVVRDRVPVVYHFITGSLANPNDEAKRMASAMAICWVDDVLKDWRTSWDEIEGAFCG